MLRALLCLSFSVVGCGSFEPAISGSGKMSVDNRAVSPFTAVDVDISCAIDVKKGDTTTVELNVDDNLLPLIKTEVEGEKLRVYSEKSIALSDGARLVITTPSLNRFAGAGSVTAVIEELSGSDMGIAIAGAGKVTSRVNGGSLDVEIAGAGSVQLDGSAQKLSVSAAGSSDVDAGKLSADDVSIDIAGSGKVQVAAEKKLDISIAGSGTVVYSGDAQVKQSIAGMGTVTKVESSSGKAKPASDAEEHSKAGAAEEPDSSPSVEP